MNSPVIESGVPIPKYAWAKYPLRKLKIGDSILINPNDVIRTRTAASTFRKRNPGYNFTVRKCDDGFRIWRIK